MRNPRYRNGTDFTIHPDKLDDPNIGGEKLIFVNSMSDIFHESAPEEAIFRLFQGMREHDQHVYQVLTKRGRRLAELGPSLPWSEHIWMGVSVGNDEEIGSSGYRPTDRIDDLRRSGAQSTFVSFEPLVGPVGPVDLSGIDWAIIGGESGPRHQRERARPMELEWARDLIVQCRLQNTAVFVKQLGDDWALRNDAAWKGGDIDTWPRDLRVREMPNLCTGHPALERREVHASVS